MKKVILALVAAAVVAVASVAPQPAEASKRSRAVATGVAIGLGAAIVGGAIASGSRPAYAYPRTYYPVAGYEPYPTYYVRAPYGCPGGYWARRPVRDRWGNVVGWSKPRFFCPY